MNFDSDTPDWSKGDGLLPAIIQDAASGRVLMLGYMNREALAATVDSSKVTFFSRSRQCLWTKGETSGNWLRLVSLALDCDRDTLLVQARPQGPTCHLGTTTCWGDELQPAIGFLAELDRVIQARKNADPESSYTARLLAEGVKRCAQKVGEEGTEVVVAALVQDNQRLIEEVADLTFHTLVLLSARGLTPADIIAELEKRHK